MSLDVSLAGVPRSGGPESIDDPTARVQRDLLAGASRVRRRIDKFIERLRDEDPRRAASFERRLNPDWAHKYLDLAAMQVRKWPMFMPHLTGFSRGYEIGVGPGYLFRLLMEVRGTEMRGCDVDPARAVVFRELRREFGITDLVDIHKVEPRQEIPIAEGSDALLAFFTSFCECFSLDDYRWLFDHCRERLSGDKQVFLLLNPRCYDAAGLDAFLRRHAEFPLLDRTRPEAEQRHRTRAFCRLSL